jgi:hypothetical protein
MKTIIPEQMISFQVIEAVELKAIEGGVWWCGTGLPHNAGLARTSGNLGNMHRVAP